MSKWTKIMERLAKHPAQGTWGPIDDLGSIQAALKAANVGHNASAAHNFCAQILRTPDYGNLASGVIMHP